MYSIESTPAPSDDTHYEDVLVAAGAEVLGIIVVVSILGFLLIWALVYVSKREPGQMVTITLGLLTLVSIGAYTFTQSEILGTIAATGIGAIAGAVTATFKSERLPQPGELDAAGEKVPSHANDAAEVEKAVTEPAPVAEPVTEPVTEPPRTTGPIPVGADAPPEEYTPPRDAVG